MVARERDQGGVALHSTTLGCSVVRAVLGELAGLGPVEVYHRTIAQESIQFGLPPLTISEADVDHVATALDAVLAKAEKLPSAMVSFAFHLTRGVAPRAVTRPRLSVGPRS